MADDLQQRYLDVLKANGELALKNASLQADLLEAHDETVALATRLDDVMRAGDLEHARMAALIEACAVVADFIETYTPDSHLARAVPTFYGIFRVYGKNARAAVAAVRPQADQFTQRLTQAEAKVAILQAQLGGWEAACAAQIAAIRRALTYLAACHDSQADMLIEDLTIAIDTNVGETLLARLADMSRTVGEQNTTIGYQDAMLALLRGACLNLLDQLALAAGDDETYWWRIGGRPLDEAYQALTLAVATTTKAGEE